MWTKAKVTEEELRKNMRYIDGVPTIQTEPTWFSFTFPIEHSFDQVRMLEWFKQNWHASIYWCAFYLLAIFVGQKLMANRKPFKLRKALFFWNLSLALFSIIYVFRTLDEFLYSYMNFGFRYVVCDGLGIRDSPAIGFWIWFAAMSKLIEFGDTAFIILRKKKLIFLHYYHHVTVCIFTWFAIPYKFAPARCFTTMNGIVHSLMYSYFAVRNAGYRVPKLVAMSITFLQIMQMFVGIFVTGYAYLNIDHCPYAQRPPVYLSMAMYGSYSVLFIRFFVKAYIYGFAQAAAETAGKDGILLDQDFETNEGGKKKI